MTGRTDIMLMVALGYAERGWRVFPLRPRSKRPYGEIYPDDAPDEVARKTAGGACWPDVRPRGQGGVHRATTDAAQLRAWWARWPDSDIGLATGPESGVWVLDADINAAKGKDGFATLRDYADQGLDLPVTVTQTTPSQGRHWLFRWPDGGDVANSSQKRLGNGLDVRGRGGYIVLPPSRHPDHAARYAWDNGTSPDQVAIAVSPPWLLERLNPTGEAAAMTREAAPRAYDSGAISAYARKALDDECARVAAAGVGAQNTTLNEAAFCIGTLVGGGAIPEAYAVRHLTVAAHAMAASYDSKRGRWKPDQLDRVIRDAIRAGAAHPRHLPEPPAPRHHGTTPAGGSPRRSGLADVAVQIWAKAVPVADPQCPNAVRTYVRSLGLDPDLAPPTLRGGHVDYRHTGASGPVLLGCHPCLIAAAGTGRVEGVALTYLAPDGRGRAVIIDPATGEILPARRPFGIVRGQAMRLAPLTGDRLVVAAPLECALTVLAAGDQPVWAVGTLEAAGSVAAPTDKAITLCIWQMARPRAERQAMIRRAADHLGRLTRRPVMVAEIPPPKGFRP